MSCFTPEKNTPSHGILGRYGLSYEVQSHTDPEKWYIIAVDKQGEIVCTCPDFRFRQSPDHSMCKHIEEALVYKDDVARLCNLEASPGMTYWDAMDGDYHIIISVDRPVGIAMVKSFSDLYNPPEKLQLSEIRRHLRAKGSKIVNRGIIS